MFFFRPNPDLDPTRFLDRTQTPCSLYLCSFFWEREQFGWWRRDGASNRNTCDGWMWWADWMESAGLIGWNRLGWLVGIGWADWFAGRIGWLGLLAGVYCLSDYICWKISLIFLLFFSLQFMGGFELQSCFRELLRLTVDIFWSQTVLFNYRGKLLIPSVSLSASSAGIGFTHRWILYIYICIYIT